MNPRHRNFRLGRLIDLLVVPAAVCVLSASANGQPLTRDIQRQQPNFVVINCDNLGYGDVGCFGSTKHRTPHIDRMAAEGMRLTSFYSASAVCTPSRAALMTGCYPRRVNMHVGDNDGIVLFPASRKGLHPDEVTIAELLKQRGYATVCIGKWHLGDQPEFLPTQQGFDEYLGIPYSDNMVGNKRVGWPPLPLMRNERVVEAPTDRNTLTMRYTHEAIGFIEKNKDRPFFLYLPHAMPGSDIAPFASKAFRGKSANGIYGDSVEEIDWSTGEILGALKRLDLDKRTLVIWTSDNGAYLDRGGSNAPLRGGLHDTTEGGFRMPCIAWWPGQIPVGATCDEVTTMMDLLPTLVRLAGGKPPADRVIDGRDIWPILSGRKDAKSPHQAFYYYYMTQLHAVRAGKWKLRLALEKKLVRPGRRQRGKVALYDLENDIGEKTNLANEFPEVVARLLKYAERAREDLGDDGREGTGQRPAAFVEKPTARRLGDLEKAKAAVAAAVPRAQKDPTRPVYHFRPPAQWMNDICGAIWYKDYYHVFYQYNPFSGDRWGDDYTLWAHARSKDLVHWQDLPWSFLPMKDCGERRCNSGCITLDGHGRPMIFYTFVPDRPDATRLGKREHWGVAPLDDNLVQWRRVKNEPLMAAGMSGVPADTNAGWSDPFVFRSGGRTFVTFKSCNGLVCEAQDKELTKWKYAGRMDGVDGECPNFFTLQGKSVLLRSTKPPTFVVGDFNPQTIEFNMNGPQGVLDYGFGSNPPKDRAWTRGLYATNVFVDKDGRRIMLGWVCGFKPGRGWNGCMSLPRILTLDENQKLVQTPAPELRKLRKQHLRVENLSISSESKRIDAAQGDTIEIMAVFEPGDATAFGLKVRCSEDGQDAVTLRYADGTLNVAGTEVPTALGENQNTLKLHIFLDKSVMEVFINDGIASVTRVNYPEEKHLGVTAFSENGDVTLKSLDVWQMKPIWN